MNQTGGKRVRPGLGSGGGGGDVPLPGYDQGMNKRTNVPARDLNDSHVVQRLHPSQGGAPARGS